MLRWSVGVGLLVTLTAPAAFAAAGGETVHFAGSFTQAGTNPCTGSSGTFSVTFNGVSHTSVSADGTVHHTATVTGETVFTPRRRQPADLYWQVHGVGRSKRQSRHDHYLDRQLP